MPGVFPVITGQTGLDPIFQGAADFDLELIENRTLDGHIQELIYDPPSTDLYGFRTGSVMPASIHAPHPGGRERSTTAPSSPSRKCAV
jgi:hypothetical protein